MRQIVFYPSVLVEHGKHGESYHHVPDDEALEKVALHILKERMKSGHFYYKPDEPKAPDFTKETIDSLPASMQEQARKKWESYVDELEGSKQDLAWFETAERALQEKDGRIAWKCLHERRDAEYEKISIEPYVRVKGP